MLTSIIIIVTITEARKREKSNLKLKERKNNVPLLFYTYIRKNKKEYIVIVHSLFLSVVASRKFFAVLFLVCSQYIYFHFSVTITVKGMHPFVLHISHISFHKSKLNKKTTSDKKLVEYKEEKKRNNVSCLLSGGISPRFSKRIQQKCTTLYVNICICSFY